MHEVWVPASRSMHGLACSRQVCEGFSIPTPASSDQVYFICMDYVPSEILTVALCMK